MARDTIKDAPFLANRYVKPGWLLHIHGRGNFRVMEPNQDSRLIMPVQDCESGEEFEFTIDELEVLASQSKIPPLFASNMEELEKAIKEYQPQTSGIPDKSVSSALIKAANLYIERNKAIDDLIEDVRRKCREKGIPFSKKDALVKAIDTLEADRKYLKGLSPASYYRINKIIKKFGGDPTMIASSLHRSTYNKTRMSGAVQNFCDTIIIRYSTKNEYMRDKESLYELALGYLQHTNGYWIDPDKCEEIPVDLLEELLNPKISMEIILNNAEKKKFLSKIKPPKRSKFYEYRRWFVHNPDQSKAEIIERYGNDFYEKQMLSFDTFAYKALLPLQFVFADHCYLDIFILDEKGGRVLRIWLTVLIDAFSRCILGFYLDERGPCIESIQLALKHAIWTKEEWLQSLDLNLPEHYKYDCFGIPLELSRDNAWAHHSISLENLCRNISFNGKYNSITLAFRPPYKGRYGALVERFFGNLQMKLKQLLTGTIRGIGPDDVRNAVKEAEIFMEDLEKEITKIILHYMYKPHSELNGMAPIQKWREGMQSMYPLVPPKTPANERLFWHGYHETRTIGQKGVSAFGLTYWSSKLQYCNRFGNDGKYVQYGFSYEPSDISRIALFRDGAYICDLYAKKLRLPDDSYLCVSLLERALARKIAIDDHRSAKDWVEYIRKATDQNAEGKGNLGKKPGKKSTTSNVNPLPEIPTGKENDYFTNLIAGFAGNTH